MQETTLEGRALRRLTSAPEVTPSFKGSRELAPPLGSVFDRGERPVACTFPQARHFNCRWNAALVLLDL